MEFDWPGIVKAFLAPAAVAAVTSFIFNTLAKGKVDSYFAKQLADHQAELKKREEKFKNELGLITEAAKFDYQRKMADFNLFAVKRHQAYPEIFRRYRTAFDAVVNFGHRAHRKQSYGDLSREEIEAVLKRKKIPATEIASVLAVWTDDRDARMTLLFDALDKSYRKRTIKRIHAAHQYAVENFLYLSPEGNEALHQFTRIFREYFTYVLNETSTDAEAITIARLEASHHLNEFARIGIRDLGGGKAELVVWQAGE